MIYTTKRIIQLLSLASLVSLISGGVQISLLTNDYSDSDSFCVLLDNSDCTCNKVTKGVGFNLQCNTSEPDSVKKAMSRTTMYDLNLVSFIYETNGLDTDLLYLPEDFLGFQVIGNITLRWTEKNVNAKLKIDPNAFRHSVIQWFSVQGFDLSEMDWAFLASLNHLYSLKFVDVDHLESFASLPELYNNNLHELSFSYCDGLNDIPALPEQMESISFQGMKINDTMASKFLNKISRTATSLKQIIFVDVPLTKVPEEIGDFRNVSRIHLLSSNISLLQEASFNNSPSRMHRWINLYNAKITFIEPRAFQGYFGFTRLYLGYNRFTRFESAVFKHVLEDMYCSMDSWARINLENTKITCDCSLAWLVRDNRHLLRFIRNGRCSNSSLVNELQPEGYGDCPPSSGELPICGAISN